MPRIDAGAVTTYTLRGRPLDLTGATRSRGGGLARGRRRTARVQIVEEPSDLVDECIGPVEHDMVIRPGNLRDPRPRDLGAESLRHRSREDRAQLAPHHEGR